jgi:ribosomal protein S8
MYRKDAKQGHDKLKNGCKSDHSTRIEVISHHEKHINQIQKHHGFIGQIAQGNEE